MLSHSSAPRRVSKLPTTPPVENESGELAANHARKRVGIEPEDPVRSSIVYQTITGMGESLPWLPIIVLFSKNKGFKLVMSEPPVCP